MSKHINIPSWVLYLAIGLALADFATGLICGLKIGLAKGQQVHVIKP